MADDDPLKLFPTAAAPGAKTSKAATDDDPLKLFPTSSQPKQTTAEQPEAGPFDVGTSGEQTAPAWMSTAPTRDQVKTALGLPNQLSPDQMAAIRSQTPLERVVQAAGEGWQNAPTVLAPGVTVDPSLGLGVNKPLVTLGNALLGAGSAAFRGSQQFLKETGDALVPANQGGSFGDVLAGLPEAFPTGDYGQPAAPGTAAQARNALNRPVTVDELTAAIRRSDAAAAADQPVPANALNPDQAAAPPPATAGPQPGMGAPQPAGAQATPAAAVTMTPEEIATQRTVADKQWLNQTVQPGVKTTGADIPGITPNLVEQEQTVTAARELKALKNLNPELTQAEKEILDRNNDIRKGFYADTVGSDVTRAADLKAANDKIETDLKQVWSGKGEADPANVQAAIKTELAGSAGDLPPLKSAMKQVSDSLENAGTDPQAMYRTHRLINYLQSKQGQMENPGYGAADVQAALTRVKGTLAQTIDNGAPGFKQAMSDYSAARGPIDAAKALQDRENGLYDSRGHMSFLKVHSLMRDIVDAQKWDAPNDPLAGVSDAQMARLKTLHDNLKVTASAKDLATAQGSDTAMNAVDIAKAYGKLAGRAGIEGAANVAFGPGVGSMIVRGAENLLRPITSGVAARRQVRRGMEILQPPPSNPLNPP